MGLIEETVKILKDFKPSIQQVNCPSVKTSVSRNNIKINPKSKPPTIAVKQFAYHALTFKVLFISSFSMISAHFIEAAIGFSSYNTLKRK